MNGPPPASSPKAVSSSSVRVIPRLDVKAPNLVKGIHLEGLRVVGKPADFARRYYEEGADEILYIDIVASLYGRNNLIEIVEDTTRDVFIPITVGGGVRCVDDMVKLLRAGADKVAINTAAVRRPEFLREASRAFGSQCVVLSIEAKRQPSNSWEAYTDNGRERTGVDAIEWARRGEELGAGEILITSVDQEGTQKGYEWELVRRVADAVTIPVIACGGAGGVDDFPRAARECHADALAAAHVFHYKKVSIGDAKRALADAGLAVRR